MATTSNPVPKARRLMRSERGRFDSARPKRLDKLPPQPVRVVAAPRKDAPSEGSE